METVVERCCGLDVHQASVVACLLVPLLGFLGSFFLLSLFISTVVERRNWIPSLIVGAAALDLWVPAAFEVQARMILEEVTAGRTAPED